MTKKKSNNIASLLKCDVCCCLADMISFQQIAMQQTTERTNERVNSSSRDGINGAITKTKKSEQNRVVLHSYREHSLFKRPSTA